ncbi:MAG: hypothetical protein FWH06_03365 [Oscillospiraceae bacterium]|nr:hypothetical protein [Oscillospiraceae bacterium]
MRGKRRRLYFPPLTVGIFVVAAVILSAVVTNSINNYSPKVKPPTDMELYEAAVKDAMLFGEDEILPLIKLGDTKMVDSNDLGQVLLIVWHDTPYLYREGGDVELDYGAVWAVADGEFAQWYAGAADNIGAADWAPRAERLLGLPPKSGLTHFSGLWVWPDDVRRPAYNPDPTASGMSAGFAGSVDPEFKLWFDRTIIEKYFDGRAPWTRLGYTYDWQPDGPENRYGLSEFIIEEGCRVSVGFTLTNADFREWLAERPYKYEQD